MPRITGSVVIDAPAEVVFDTVADERNEPRYNPRIARAEMLTPEPVTAGSRFRAWPRGGGERAGMDVTLVEHDRPHRLVTAVRSRSLDVDGVLTVRPGPAGTVLTWDWSTRPRGAARLLTPLLALVGPRWERRNWVGLKHHLERGAPPAARA
ncbi:SRPBCC family protein [Thalassiella azotivora]